MEQTRDLRGHSTADEIHFLDKLGTCIPTGHRPYHQKEMSDRQYRTHLLRNYVAAATRRSDWAHVDGMVVMNHARGLLQRAEGKLF